MTSFLGTLDVRTLMRHPTIGDITWASRANRPDFTHQPFHELGARTRKRFRGRPWPRCSFMTAGEGMNICHLGQEMAEPWARWQREQSGHRALKYFLGQCVDGSAVPIPSAIVQGFVTSNDLYVGETVADSQGNYLLATPYAGVAHYLVAYLPGSPDIAGTTVNTLVPTNADGT